MATKRINKATKASKATTANTKAKARAPKTGSLTRPAKAPPRQKATAPAPISRGPYRKVYVTHAFTNVRGPGRLFSSFIYHGGAVVIHVHGTAWAEYRDAELQLVLLVDENYVLGRLVSYSNESWSHKAIGGTVFVPPGVLRDGRRSLLLAASPQSDTNDRYSMTITEFV